MKQLSDATILIVDDDARMCESIRRILHWDGYDRVHICTNLPDALHWMAKTSYDLVLLDLQLKNQNGFTVMDDLGRRNPDTDVIIATGEHFYQQGICRLSGPRSEGTHWPFI